MKKLAKKDVRQKFNSKNQGIFLTKAVFPKIIVKTSKKKTQKMRNY